jgi:prepilin-type N-terminal cleavage/methylation domain-containing protein
MLELTPTPSKAPAEAGFTLIELLMAMTVFSFMLLIIVVGFMNIVRMHNQAVASNMAQDSARSAMNELVRAVRDSGGVTYVSLPSTPGQMCLASTTGQPQQYYVENGSLKRADGCGGISRTSSHQLTSNAVEVQDFTPTLETAGTNISKAQVKLSLTIGSANGTTEMVNGKLQCGPGNAERTFCAVVTLTSEAVQR